MMLPDERTRALLWAGSFLIKLAQDKSLPFKVRRQAAVIARHITTIEDIPLMAKFRLEFGIGVGLATPWDTSWEENYPTQAPAPLHAVSFPRRVTRAGSVCTHCASASLARFGSPPQRVKPAGEVLHDKR
jgi:hypothetical protein